MSDDRTYTLADTALLAVLNIGRYDGRKLDKAATARAIASHGAQDGAASLRKQTISRDALAEIRTASNEARTFHYAATFPWSHGRGLLPSSKVLAYRDAMVAYQRRFYEAVDKLVADLPAVIEDARTRLGDMFDPDDYPTAGELRRKFEFGFTFESVPSGDFRCAGDLRDELASAAKDDERKRLLGLVWSQIEEPAATLADRLRAYKPAEQSETGKAEGVFRASTHTKLAELHASLTCLFPAETRDALGDPDLGRAMAALSSIADVTTDALRDDTTARARITAEAQALADLCRAKMRGNDPADFDTEPAVIGSDTAPRPAADPVDGLDGLDFDASDPEPIPVEPVETPRPVAATTPAPADTPDSDEFGDLGTLDELPDTLAAGTQPAELSASDGADIVGEIDTDTDADVDLDSLADFV